MASPTGIKPSQRLANFHNERDYTYSRYQNITNMHYGELLDWSKNPCSKKASIGREAIKRNLKLKGTPKGLWSKKDVEEAKKSISFISRHKGQPSGKAVKGCGVSKRTIALMNWAYNPNK